MSAEYFGMSNSRYSVPECVAPPIAMTQSDYIVTQTENEQWWPYPLHGCVVNLGT